VTAIPRIVSEWPPRYFVAEWNAMSAPSASGFWRAGEANVLSTTRNGRALPDCSARSRSVFAAAAMSVSLRFGFDGVSNQTSRVRSERASQSASGSPARFAYFVVRPLGRRTRSR